MSEIGIKLDEEKKEENFPLIGSFSISHAFHKDTKKLFKLLAWKVISNNFSKTEIQRKQKKELQKSFRISPESSWRILFCKNCNQIFPKNGQIFFI